ncbi:MAG: hypothetical protein AAGN66_05510 [Acidobacteriota bacterium]
MTRERQHQSADSRGAGVVRQIRELLDRLEFGDLSQEPVRLTLIARLPDRSEISGLVATNDDPELAMTLLRGHRGPST